MIFLGALSDFLSLFTRVILVTLVTELQPLPDSLSLTSPMSDKQTNIHLKKNQQFFG